jgi:hypothetical protein
MTVQPTTSDPNEREAFREWFDEQFNHIDVSIYASNDFIKGKSNMHYGFTAAWHHQQKKIDDVIKLSVDLISENAGLKNKIDSIIYTDNSAVIESLQAQLNVAVEALEIIENWTFGWDGDCGVTSKATEAINTITKMKGE